jgi:hypothetical protein
MSEYIKTGQEIWNEINEYSDASGQHEWSNLKWVSLSWLKEQKKKLKDKNWSWLLYEGLGYRVTEDKETEEALRITVDKIIDDWFLSLLEEKL